MSKFYLFLVPDSNEILVPKFLSIHKINRLFVLDSCNETKLFTIADAVSELNSKPVLVQVRN